ncbi:ABC-three component system middle component 7 [Clostridium coskatii]|uniref:Uncharacterized protein n=1 Tax=Clostridium coskatii TaxID=1705578 RepID=A0A166U3T4_9CLOT|nr:ABC-three component system middle component 7 [Clostridium coskatii]OAA94536.1 hypothetical protein WX73_03082 [Clostridium coskatii]OBR93280.1 hypothetical protein CLCOS_27520 [Clostridium coskatii]
MKLPNKLFNYGESIISKFPIILKILEQKKYLTIYELYEHVITHFNDITEFIDTVECLYALNKIEYNNKLRRIYYVV